MASDLNVAAPDAETPHHRLRRNRAFVAVVQDPADCCQTTFDRRYFQELKFSELVLDSVRYLKFIPMRPTYSSCRWERKEQEQPVRGTLRQRLR